MIKQNVPAGSGQSYWLFPGGKVEENETFLYAAIREVYEETGLDVSAAPRRLAYVCEYGSAIDKFSCKVEMYDFSTCDGNPVVDNDPDHAVEKVAFFPIHKALLKLELIPFVMVRDPALYYLNNSDQKPLHWIYRQNEGGEYILTQKNALDLNF